MPRKGRHQRNYRRRVRAQKLAHGSEAIAPSGIHGVVINEKKAGRVVAKKFSERAFTNLRSAILSSLVPKGAVKTLADMTAQERAAIEERYGAKIKS